MMLHPLQNHFLEIDPSQAVLESGRLGFPFQEDILQLHRERMILDLGWCPDGDPNGAYRLVLIQWDIPKEQARPKPTIRIEL